MANELRRSPTVGELRRLTEGMDDAAYVAPDWAAGCAPDDEAPAVEICDLALESDDTGRAYLSVKVRLVEGEEEDEHGGA